MTPSAPEAEKAVISAVLATSGAVLMDVDFLKPDHFADRINQEVFSLARGLWEDGSKPNKVSVSEALKDAGIPPATLDEYDTPTEGGDVREWANLIVGKWRAREIVRISNEASDAAIDGVPEDVLDELERQIIELRPESGSGLRHLDGSDFFKERDNSVGIASGLREIDAYLGGLGVGRLITFASRPGVGKTTLALNIAANAASVGRKVALFSLEMSYGELLDRILAREAQVSGTKIRNQRLGLEDYDRLVKVSERVTSWPLYVDETAALATFEIAARTKKLKHDSGLDLIVIDYLQLVTPPKAESRVQELAIITRTFKLLARELSVPVVVLSQLNRAAEVRGGKPRQSDLRESGSIENDSDQIVFLWRENEEAEQDDRPIYTNVSVSKNRHGPTGDFVLQFVPSQSRFDSAG